MMKYMKLEILSLLLLLNVACNNDKKDGNKVQSPKYLIGYWIPQEIAWGGDNPNGKDTGDVFRTAHFRTLCFDAASNKFLYFASTQRHPRDYNDSIIFAGEPIVNVFGGSWKITSDTSLMVNYKPIEYEINPPDTSERQGHIKILLEKDTLLLFENTLYHRTNKYDKISQQTIEEYKKHYLK